MSWPGSLWAGDGWTKSWGRFEALPAPKKPSSSVAQLVCHMRKGAQCHTPGCWPPELSQHAVGKCHQCLERDCSVWVFSAAGAACRRGLYSALPGVTKMLVAMLVRLPGR